MSKYVITQYTKNKAQEMNLIVQPSKNPKKKIDIFDKKQKFITSAGSYGNMDYPNYIKKEGQEYANKRRILYRKRHAKDLLKKDSLAGYFGNKLLW